MGSAIGETFDWAGAGCVLAVPMRVLVTDGANRAALAVTRSLGARGHHVIVADGRQSALAHTSRFCWQRAVYPDPVHQEDAFVDWLLSTVREQSVDVLLPISDVTTLLTTAHRTAFPASCQIPFTSHARIARAADKADMLRTAMRIGIPVPRTTILENSVKLREVQDQLSYPVVIKPPRSRVATGAAWLSTSVRYAADFQALEADVNRRHELEFPLLLQECISGEGVGVFLCYDQGRLVAMFSHRRLREKPPSGGVSVLSESIAMPPDGLNYSEALLSDLGWHGIVMVEFKRDRRDQSLKLMEVNGRFWGSLQLAVDAGVDFPAILVEMAAGRVPASPPSYRVGVRSRWLMGDLDSLLLTLRPKRNAASPAVDRIGTIAQFLKFWQKDLYYENPRWSDLQPWFRESAIWLRNLVS
jgi:predicted ATP-grasp superfamily ATP-dependent carboligase